MKEVYVVLTRLNTLPAKIIGKYTKDRFTHASISFDRNLKTMYSFGRLVKWNPLYGGFVKENIRKGLYGDNQNTLMKVLAISVSDEVYDRLEKEVVEYGKKGYKYNFLGLINFIFDTTFSFRRHMFCSEFVATVLMNNDLFASRKLPCQIKPNDFSKEGNFKLVYQGAINNYKGENYDKG